MNTAVKLLLQDVSRVGDMIAEYLTEEAILPCERSEVLAEALSTIAMRAREALCEDKAKRDAQALRSAIQDNSI